MVNNAHATAAIRTGFSPAAAPPAGNAAQATARAASTATASAGLTRMAIVIPGSP